MMLRCIAYFIAASDIVTFASYSFLVTRIFYSDQYRIGEFCHTIPNRPILPDTYIK
jgi:hypothetical protein